MSDIVQRLRFDAARCEATFSKGVAGNIEEAADEIERLRAALDAIGAMFYVGVGGAVLLKPDFGNYDVLDTVNAALANEQKGDAE